MRRNRRTYGPKRKYAGRRKAVAKRRRIAAVPRSPFSRRCLLPDNQIIKFRYYEQLTLNPATGAVAVFVFSGNGMYDPNVTGVGMQPRGFDQIMGLYRHYAVLNSRITVKWGAVASSANNYIVGCSLRDTPTADLTLVDYAEDYRVTSDVLTLGAPSIDTGMDYSTTEFFGISRTAVLGRGNLLGTNAANPVEQAYFHIFATGLNPSEDPGSINAYVVIDYVAQLQEHTLPPQS